MALGSGAFANEAINQLAEAYLDRKQRETGRIIPHDQYATEKQKVKMFIADHNVFGVDLNPVAVELAEISLWLNTIFDGAYVPWFGMQLVAGNSLIGARRRVFPASRVIKQERGQPSFLDLVPDRRSLKVEQSGDMLTSGDIFHFLLPDSGMADYTDKVVKQLAPTEMEHIKKWRKKFIQPFDDGEVTTLVRYSQAIEKLWRKHIEQQKRIRERTSDIVPVFGQEETMKPTAWTSTQDKDKILQQELLSENVRNSSPYRRLKLVMDYWCALWFWPIEKAHLLPTRDEFLMDLSLIIEGGVYEAQALAGRQLMMFAETAPKEEQFKLVDEFGFVDVSKLCREVPRLKLVAELGQEFHFHHWELEFADLFATRGGFDLLVGNPPWIKVEWDEGGFLGDYEPQFVIRIFSAAQMTQLRKVSIDRHNILSEYLIKFVESSSAQTYLSANQNFGLLAGSKTNLYKCFISQAWNIANSSGVIGLLHPEGVYDDSNGRAMRRYLYQKLVYHFHFQNVKMLFPNVLWWLRYSINIYSNQNRNPEFLNISNLFHPVTIDQSFSHVSGGICEGIKNESDKWGVTGHKDRIIEIDEHALKICVSVFDDLGTPWEEDRLPVIHSIQILDVLAKFSGQVRRINELDNEMVLTQHWNEVSSCEAGIITELTCFPEELI